MFKFLNWKNNFSNIFVRVKEKLKWKPSLISNFKDQKLSKTRKQENIIALGIFFFLSAKKPTNDKNYYKKNGVFSSVIKILCTYFYAETMWCSPLPQKLLSKILVILFR